MKSVDEDDSSVPLKGRDAFTEVYKVNRQDKTRLVPVQPIAVEMSVKGRRSGGRAWVRSWGKQARAGGEGGTPSVM